MSTQNRSVHLRRFRRCLVPTSLLLLNQLISLPAASEDGGNLYDTEFDIREGRSYFERQCSRCHGFDATGNDEVGAPDLTGTLARASTNVGIFNIIREGIPGTAMLPVTPDVPDATVWQLVSYIDSLSTDPANVDLPGSTINGERLFAEKGNCNSCHMVNGVGGRSGPDLSLVGERRDPDELMSDLIDPDYEVNPRWWRLRITELDGTVREGFRMNESSFSLHIMDDNDELWSYPKNRIASYERLEQDSTMPSYAQSLTDSELDDLVAYLYWLRKEN